MIGAVPTFVAGAEKPAILIVVPAGRSPVEISRALKSSLEVYRWIGMFAIPIDISMEVRCSLTRPFGRDRSTPLGWSPPSKFRSTFQKPKLKRRLANVAESESAVDPDRKTAGRSVANPIGVAR
ncbi:hypothetical protein KM043_006337 [Ampulex compressa]|nr:hypothetical protein KM043_006337 [Ampulex compressa]